MARATPPDRIAAANAANRRRGDETAAARLRDHGWIVIPPEAVADLPPEVVQRVTRYTEPKR